MRLWRIAVPPEVAENVRHLAPGVKRAVRAAMHRLASHPEEGEPLQGELEGLFKYRVRRFRIVYRLARDSRTVRIIAVGHRRSVYEELAERSRQDQ